MHQIARRACLTLGGIHNHFPSNETIFSELILDRHPHRQILRIMLNIPIHDPEIIAGSATNQVDRTWKATRFHKGNAYRDRLNSTESQFYPLWNLESPRLSPRRHLNRADEFQ
jgi:AcrR family transcriptional regulator